MAGGVITHSSVNSGPPTEGSRMYAVIVCVFASLGGIFFGYDQGVTGGVLVMPSFLNDFCIDMNDKIVIHPNFTELNIYTVCKPKNTADLPDNWTNFTTLFNVLYYLGCVFGAFIGGFVADKFGRRMTIFNAGFWFCVGTVMLCFAPVNGHTMALIARIFQGIGVGNSSFSLPIFGAEMAPKELRGMLSGFMQMAIVTGLLLAGICNLIVKDDPKGWRTTNAVAMIFPLIVMVGIFCVPESPRWMYKTKGRESAAAELKRLRKTENVNTELQAIGDALEQEGNDSATWNDLLHPSIRPRLFIAMFLQVLQQATGINPMFVYGGQIFESVASNGIISLFILQIVNFVSTIPAMHWVDRFGRRSLLLLGAMGMVAGHVVAGISFSVGCKGQGENLECDSTAGWVMIIATAFFIFNFAISWGPVCWIYPAEIFPLKVRAKAVSASTMSNWTMGMLMMVIPKLFVHLGINGVFFLFGVLCAGAGLFVYFKCPETKGLLLEEIELLFNGPSLEGKGIDGTPREMC